MSVESMMDKINGSGFDFIRNLENIIMTYMYSPPPTAYTSDTDTVSWYVFTDGGVEGDWTFSMFSDSDHPVKVSHSKGIDTIIISKEGNTYSCQLDCDYSYSGDSSYYFYRANYPDRSSCGFYTGSYFTGNFQPFVQGWTTKNLTSNSLEGILGEISKYAKNVNIVIDEATYTSNGGGATHIAKVTGQLKDLSSNLSDILMVSGGGGGGYLVGDGSINPNYIFSGANQTFAITNSTTEGYRPFTKENAGDAIAFIYYESTSTWYGPALISKIENATYYNLYNQYFQRDSVSAVIDGETWYVSKPGLWCHYPDSNPNWNLPVLRGHDYTTDWVLGNEISASNIEKLIKKVLQLAKGIYDGEEAGGMQGSGSNSGTQSTGNAFGQGESGSGDSGGGSGLYGGYKRGNNISSGAGSGYIGNSLTSNKKMVGYDVLTSDTEATKTESVLDVSISAVSGKPKIGNGFARIKFLRDWEGDEEMNYSKSEHLVGTWIDGSNLYEKTFEFLNQSLLQTGQAYDTDLSNIKCVYLHGFIKEGDNTYPLVWGSSAGFGIYYDSSTNKIRTKASDSFRNADMYITVRYVKL